MTHDRYGAKQDRLDELIEQDEREKHQAGDCKGAPECGECLDEQEGGEKMKFRKKPVVCEKINRGEIKPGRTQFDENKSNYSQCRENL